MTNTAGKIFLAIPETYDFTEAAPEGFKEDHEEGLFWLDKDGEAISPRDIATDPKYSEYAGYVSIGVREPVRAFTSRSQAEGWIKKYGYRYKEGLKLYEVIVEVGSVEEVFELQEK